MYINKYNSVDICFHYRRLNLGLPTCESRTLLLKYIPNSLSFTLKSH